MSFVNDIRAELVRARSYRLTWAIWPLIAFTAAGFNAFAVSAVHSALATGESAADQISSVAFLPGMSSGLTGLFVAILATTLVTADEGSGTTRSLRMVMSDRRIVAARAAVVGLVALAATAITTLVAVLGAATLPTTVALASLGSAQFWGNVVSTVFVHLTWGLLALAFASWWPRAAVSMGGVLAVMLGAPSVEMALRAAQWETGAFAWLPEPLIRAATATGAGAATVMTAPAAVAVLALWCVALAALASAGTNRLRRVPGA